MNTSESIIRLPEVEARTGYKRSSIYELMGKGKFPQSVKLGERAVGWQESLVSQWIEDRINASQAAA